LENPSFHFQLEGSSSPSTKLSTSLRLHRALILSFFLSSQNPKGYTIPLDKRLAADGRGLQEVQINDNFAKLSEVTKKLKLLSGAITV
jgi:hypothetical protein